VESVLSIGPTPKRSPEPGVLGFPRRRDLYAFVRRIGCAATNIAEKRPARKPSIAKRVPGRRTAIARERTMVMQEDMVVTESELLAVKRWVKIIARRREPTRERW